MKNDVLSYSCKIAKFLFLFFYKCEIIDYTMKSIKYISSYSKATKTTLMGYLIASAC